MDLVKLRNCVHKEMRGGVYFGFFWSKIKLSAALGFFVRSCACARVRMVLHEWFSGIDR